MNGLVLYKSKYGATHQYAEWIAEYFKLQITAISEFNPEHLDDYDFLIIGSPVYVGKLLIKRWFAKNLEGLWNKKIFLFVPCGTNLDDKKALQSFITSSIPAEALNKCDVFFLPGRLNKAKLSLTDSIILRIGAALAKTKAIKEKMLTDYDAVSQEHLAELLLAIKSFLILKTETIPHKVVETIHKG